MQILRDYVKLELGLEIDFTLLSMISFQSHAVLSDPLIIGEVLIRYIFTIIIENSLVICSCINLNNNVVNESLQGKG